MERDVNVSSSPFGVDHMVVKVAQEIPLLKELVDPCELNVFELTQDMSPETA